MIFRQLDVNGDWTYGKGTQNFARDQQAIALNLQTLVRSWQGDCFFSLQSGINWKQLMNYGQQANLDTALQTLILQAYGVVGFPPGTPPSINFNSSSRHFAAVYTVNTVYSTQITEQLAILSNSVGN